MGKSVNKVQLIGTLGRDPEARTTGSGSMVVTISLATDEGYFDKNTGNKIERTEWHKVTVFGKLAEICQQYLRKGHKAYFEGKLKTDEYTDKDGIKRYGTGIIANDMMMLTPQQQQQTYQQPMQQPVQQHGYQQPVQQQYQPQQPQFQPQPIAQPQMGEFDDQVPF